MLSLYLILLLISTNWATPIPERVEYSPLSYVMQVLRGIDLVTNDLTSAIDNWNGTMEDAGDVVLAEFTIGRYITDLHIMGPPLPLNSTADSLIMTEYVNGTLSPDIVTSLVTVAGRQSNFSVLGMDSNVVTELRSLWGQLDDLRWTMVNISTNDTRAAARGSLKDVDAAFSATIGVFS